MTSPNVHGVTTLLEIFDMGRSVAFYRALGFAVVAHWPDREHEEKWDWVRLRLGGAELMLNTRYELEERPMAPDAVRSAGHADTELFFGCADLDGLCRDFRLGGMGAPEPETTFYGTRLVRLIDPDGFVICFQSPI
jgi:catechol 2,3-dioxygenase-like lactoylglutathione lyase family enzyme